MYSSRSRLNRLALFSLSENTGSLQNLVRTITSMVLKVRLMLVFRSVVIVNGSLEPSM